jgi:2-polyprenyl-6-methoxyphenol hydroxylase-like FAD-dependent oxidoreductase
MSTTRTALIVGGGVAGPVAATALRMAGIEATVHEAYPGPAYNIGNTLGFAANGLAALDVIGAGDALRKVAVPMPNMAMAFGHKTVEMPGVTGVEPLQLVDRSDLHRVLHDHAVAAGIRFEYSKRLVRFEEHPDSVTAHFADGTSATADVLIGAGGLHIMPPVPTWYRGRMVLVGDSVHAPSNSTGQGASQAVESAVQLARCLRDFDDPATAFAAYERIRRPRVERIAARGAKIRATPSTGTPRWTSGPNWPGPEPIPAGMTAPSSRRDGWELPRFHRIGYSPASADPRSCVAVLPPELTLK